MKTQQISVLTFHFQFLLFFQFYPSFTHSFHPHISLGLSLKRIPSSSSNLLKTSIHLKINVNLKEFRETEYWKSSQTTVQIHPPIMRNIKLVPEFVRRPSKWSLRPNALLLLLICHLACCVVLYMCHQGSHVYKDQFDGNEKKFSFNFSTFFVFPILPLYYPYLPSSHFTQTHQTRPWPFSFPLKPSPSSPLQNHHHLRWSTLDFWRKNLSMVKVMLDWYWARRRKCWKCCCWKCWKCCARKCRKYWKCCA